MQRIMGKDWTMMLVIMTIHRWCLGMQYWINNPTLNLSNIKTAIHFDMVGGLNATFPREYFSD